MRTSGHGFVGIGRKKLLNILQARCEELGVELCSRREVDSDLDFPDADLIIAATASTRKIRNQIRRRLQARHRCCGRTASSGSAPTSCSTPSPSTSARPSTAGSRRTSTSSTTSTSTFIVETTEEAFCAHGLDKMDQEESIAFCENLFAEILEGHALMSNARHLRGSAWLNRSRA